jgi:hypothetical protein
MKTTAIALVFVVLVLQVNGSGQSAQLPPASDMKTLGLIGGTSWYSTVDYYRHVNGAIDDTYVNRTNPPLILYNTNRRKFTSSRRRGNGTNLPPSAHRRLSGCMLAELKRSCFAPIHPHKVYAQVSRKTDLPILHIGDAIGVAAQSSGLKKVGLIGTLYTMEDGLMDAPRFYEIRHSRSPNSRHCVSLSINMAAGGPIWPAL